MGIFSGVKRSLVAELRARGLLSQLTRESLEQQLQSGKKVGVYLGADPSGDSLHLGNLMPFMVLMHFFLRGHRVFPLVGGATGVVGDPSGRKSERELMLAQQRERNVAQISAQMRAILANCAVLARQNGLDTAAVSDSQVIPVNNRSWWAGIGMLDFLGTFGRHFRVNAMVARESVRQRLASDAGLGYNEFSYQVLQAYDFYHLYRNHNCAGQIGGHDQWGNIVAGVDLINRLRNNADAGADADADTEPFGLTVPLLLTPSGEKFGKSAGNAAVFLSAQRTSPYHLYQHLVQSPDEAVERYLLAFTFVPVEEIKALVQDHAREPERRRAQHRLAAEVTQLVHGPELTLSSKIISGVMFGGDVQRTDAEILAAFESQNLAVQRADVVGTPWRTLLAELSGRSKSECQRLLRSGAVYVGIDRRPVSSNNVEISDVSEKGLLLLRVGKSEYHVVRVIEHGHNTVEPVSDH